MNLHTIYNDRPGFGNINSTRFFAVFTGNENRFIGKCRQIAQPCNDLGIPFSEFFGMQMIIRRLQEYLLFIIVMS